MGINMSDNEFSKHDLYVSDIKEVTNITFCYYKDTPWNMMLTVKNQKNDIVTFILPLSKEYDIYKLAKEEVFVEYG